MLFLVDVRLRKIGGRWPIQTNWFDQLREFSP